MNDGNATRDAQQANMSDRPTRLRLFVIAQVPQELQRALAVDNDLVLRLMEGTEPGQWPAIPAECTALLTRAVFGIPAALLEKLPNLQLVVSLGAGVEQIDQRELARRGITLVHTPDELSEDVADYVVGMIYATQRNIVAADRFVRSGAWRAGRFGYSRRVCSCRVGLVGMGRIGARIAAKLAALGMTISYYNRSARPDLSYPQFATVVALAEAVDVLVVACAGTRETHHLVNADVLRALGPEGIVINIARGSIIDESALIEALSANTIAGAALDVFESEPNPDPRLLELTNAVLSPHAASLTVESRQAMHSRLVGGVRDYLGRRGPQRITF
jgi:lactate dehydrogenase-like 2-hydroxyacid dehydrogenase